MTCDPLVTAFAREISALLPATTAGMVVAVSGGADSMALLHLLVRSGLMRGRRGVVAHFDHALRDSSAADADFVVDWATRLELEVRVERWLEPKGAGNVPERARLARYDFLVRVAREVGAGAVLTGHQMEDQAETFLERLLRGSGVRGLAAMAAARPLAAAGEEAEVLLVRPLLKFRRAVLRQWLQGLGLPWLEDPGNADRRRVRSRVRYQLLPALAAIHPDDDPVPHLAATAERMRMAEAALAWAWRGVREELDWQSPAVGMVSLSHARLVVLPVDFMRRAVVECHATLTGDIFPPGARAVAGFVRHVCSRRRVWVMRMRGLVVRREGDC
ncbi:MAG: tRNA lysidine(34) synthetase TilS [Magnetococcales bacterium]|nr:tRNA lysidine(34) synthetase TilS [Magnetococcales bacterium]